MAWGRTKQIYIFPTSNRIRKCLTSSSSDECLFQTSRKKKSPTIQPYNDGPSSMRGMSNHQGSHSTSSTPLLRPTRLQLGDIVKNEGDSLSPVDWSMPPPATLPAMQTNLMASMHTNIPSSQIEPVTPASIMSLGEFTRSINPQANNGASPSQLDAVSSTPQRNESSRRSTLRSPAPNNCFGKNFVAVFFLFLIPILAASSGVTPGFQRKTTHKAAEQMRRDSLKTTFDGLRGLLPPILLPSDDKYPLDEPVLSGALPPRGAPKTGPDCPNEGASKLQLLMCGNDFIRKLRERLERRDEEIARLRQEIGKLRNVIIDNGGHGYFEEGIKPVDLDEIEVMNSATS
ncbi:hypothetical protein ARMGADRAFT_1062485 [Armillaria gallica]|uniref:BHLH domain-containing protein n=1 Tax=Armillaria gallica TaxID=47427 RepID=A0A2H3E0U9_ARMGA|nr:hypothetical protein ARMGADRAFT_1062485 [Armillaria gallica]